MIRSDVNNWTPWILSNILICMLYWETETFRLAEGVGRVMEMLNRYVAVLPEDGGCDEGPTYYNHAGASFFDCLEILECVSDDVKPLYREEKIRNMLGYISKMYKYYDAEENEQCREMIEDNIAEIVFYKVEMSQI